MVDDKDSESATLVVTNDLAGASDLARTWNKPSSIALDECFSAGDDAFLDRILAYGNPGKLQNLVNKWKVDSRPWARKMIKGYLAEPMSMPAHEVVVKRLFKQAEEKLDHEMMGWFFVAFDRLIRRYRSEYYYYDRSTRQYVKYHRLRTGAEASKYGSETVRGPYIFTNRTRHYLRRRVWRYFRYLSYADGEAYRSSIVNTIKLYRDSDFASGENIIDNWSLMHACYFDSPVIRFGAALVYLEDGHQLGDLAPAPYQKHLWQNGEAFHQLLEVIKEAESSFVRLWAMELVQREHEQSLADMQLPQLLPLLVHEDPRVQEFAALLFNKLPSLGSIPVETWLKLLETDNLSVQTLLCDAMNEHVAPERFDKGQLVDLTCMASVPIARMGFELLKKRYESASFSAEEMAELAGVQCEAVAGQVTSWVLKVLGSRESYSAELVVRFFDSLQMSARKEAVNWLTEDAPGWNDPQLWVKLIETPYADVRDAVVDKLEARIKHPIGNGDELAPLWSAVILGVHRGGRQKPKAIRQIVGAIKRKPQRAERLSPVLAIAVRSIRGPERRAGLAAVVELAVSDPQLHASFGELIPELNMPAPLEPGGVSCN